MKPFDHPFTAGGQEYVLRYSFHARRVFEKRTGKSVAGVIRRIADPATQTADDIIDMFMMLLESSKPGISADEVEKVICDMGGEDEALTLLTKAISPEDAANPQ